MFRTAAAPAPIRQEPASSASSRERAAAKEAIDSKIAQQKSLLSSIKGEIARMVAAEQARQRQLAAAAQVRGARRQSGRVAGGGRHGCRDHGAGAASRTRSVAPPSSFSGAVGEAMSELGKPYVWAASGPDSFDCSGLVVYSFAAVGKSLPHSTYALYSMGAPVSRDQLEPGDLVFFDGSATSGSTSAGASSSTPRTPATSSRSPASPKAGTRRATSAPAASSSSLASSLRNRALRRPRRSGRGSPCGESSASASARRAPVRSRGAGSGTA